MDYTNSKNDLEQCQRNIYMGDEGLKLDKQSARRTGVFAFIAFFLPMLIMFAGCAHSQMIPVTVTNTSTENLSTIVVTYPEATFGVNKLEPGKSFYYKIKPTATGTLKVEFLNSRGAARVCPGPVLQQGSEGTIDIQLTQDGATWVAKTK